VKEKRVPFRHDYYEVSNLGIVYRLKPGKSTYVGKILKAHLSKKGYLKVTTTYHGRPKNHYVHKLVAASFLGPCPDGMEVNHKNRDKTNNRENNLEYLTHLDNVNHGHKGYEHGWAPLGKQNHKLIEKEVREIRRRYKKYIKGNFDNTSRRLTLDDLAEEFGVSNPTIQKIVYGETWKEAA